MNEEIQMTEFLIRKMDKLEPICRICLSENTEQARSVYDEYESSNIASIMMLCARVQIVCLDGLPDIICSQCLGDLEAANSFRVRCELSDSLLRKVYSNPDHSKVQKKEDITENHDVKEEVSCEPCIKSELEDSADTDAQYDIFENSLSQCDNTNDIEGIQSSKKESYSHSLDIITKIESEGKESIDYNLDRNEVQTIDKRKRKLKPFICKVCGRPLSSERSLDNHILKMHSSSRKLHMGTITGFGKDKRFNCSECSYSARRRQALVYHSRRHTGEKPYKCTVCNDRFTQPGSLASHYRIHSGEKHHTCPECGKQFKEKGGLEKHKHIHSDAKNFICELCNKSLKSKESLAIHIKRHLNIRDYSCEQCGLTFVSSVGLFNHSKQHTDVKRFECKICEFKTRTKRALIGHTVRHTGERTLECEMCSYLAYDKQSMKKHMITHTHLRNYSCPVCDMKFVQSSSVNRHMWRIHKTRYRVRDHTDRRIIK